ncbi:MAG: nucleotide exchange factor GrpE [Alphaproteobacteria bacterium]|nr:nucleotide exchange factor GrpE [Alphaproteobacteria bacterium]
MAAGSHDSDPLSPEPLAPAEDRSTEIDALQNELGRTKDQMVRALADAENARKRAAKDREDASKYAISSFAKDMIDVADNLRRALEAVPQDLAATDPRLSGLIDGIEATERTLLKNLEKHGVKKIEPLHQVFDPNFHEVMFEASSPEHAAGTVIQMIETGYVLKDRLLRPARVGVAKDEGQGNGNGAASGQSTTSGPGGQIDTQA